MNILITGGCGFIGSHVTKHFVKKYKNYTIFNLDNLTYSGTKKNLLDIENYKNYNFIKGDIKDKNLVGKIFNENNIERIIHLAAESHVDNSIDNPFIFAQTNIIGTLNLLDAFKKFVKSKNALFYSISTDEVYGALGKSGYFSETNNYDPSSPYSASKASSDHFVRAYGKTYNIPYVISNCSNNYGPNQHPEKLIPKTILNILSNNKIPVYGNGENVRDWLHVQDHVYAIDLIFHNCKIGESYNIGGDTELSNIDLVRLICQTMDKKLLKKSGESEKLINFIDDRKGHDYRYAIDCSKLKSNLNWKAKINFDQGIISTVDWYLSNKKWLNDIKIR